MSIGRTQQGSERGDVVEFCTFFIFLGDDQPQRGVSMQGSDVDILDPGHEHRDATLFSVSIKFS